MTQKLSKTVDAVNAIINEITATTGDDVGLSITTGQLSIGSPGSPQEAVFGGGDSYPVGNNNSIAFHADMANLTDLVLTGATDVTIILGSDNSSNTGLFGGTAAGKMLLVGSDYPFGGAKAKIITKAVMDATLVTAEYMASSNVWIPATVMATTSSDPKRQMNIEIGTTQDGISEHWRFGFNPLSLPVSWDKVTMTIDEVEYNKYWARIRLTDAITTDMVLEQIKLHTNRVEIDETGNEYFGRARTPRQLSFGWGDTLQLEGYSPANETIDIGVGISLVYTDNEFSASAIDGRGGILNIPAGIDTSIPLIMVFVWQPLVNTAGDVVYRIESVQKKEGDTMDNLTAPETTEGTVSVEAGSDNKLFITKILINIERLNPGELLGFAFKRIGNDAADTLAGSIAISKIGIVGHYWR